jgi:intracellular sulfur oxidation DsrE/DsrF family protein
MIRNLVSGVVAEGEVEVVPLSAGLAFLSASSSAMEACA